MSIFPDWVGTAYTDTDINSLVVELGTAIGVDLVDSTIEVSNEQGQDLTVKTSYDICPEVPDTTVDVLKKEYSIVGDGLYASISAEEAPQWLTTIIDSVVETAVNSGLVNYDSLVQDVQSAIDALDVAANTYVEQINFDAQVNAIISTRLTTLNATLETTYATITSLDAAVATADSALTQKANEITSAYTAEINSQISTIQTAYTDADTALASDINALSVAFIDQETNLIATADALTALQTYVGVDAAGASTFTNLSAYIETPEGVIGGATSAVTNGVYVNGIGDPESQFEYVSSLYKNGNYYTAGFGLKLSTLNGGSGTELDPYTSEFWIDAERFRFTNTAASGTVTPFTIDASGPTPQIAFNGIVSFSNLSDPPTHTSGTGGPTGTAVLGSTYMQTDTDPDTLWVYTTTGWAQGGDPNALTAEDVSATGTTVIDGGRINTNTLQADRLVASTSGATVWTGGALVSSSFNGNPVGSIGSPTTGFRLSSSGSSYTDPSLYGAYMRGGTITGSTLQTNEDPVTNGGIKIIGDTLIVYDAAGISRVKLGDLT